MTTEASWICCQISPDTSSGRTTPVVPRLMSTMMVLAFYGSEPTLERSSELLRRGGLRWGALRPLGEVGLGCGRTLTCCELGEALRLLPDRVLIRAGEEHLGILSGDRELGGDLPPQSLRGRLRGGLLSLLRGGLRLLQVAHLCGLDLLEPLLILGCGFLGSLAGIPLGSQRLLAGIAQRLGVSVALLRSLGLGRRGRLVRV